MEGTGEKGIEIVTKVKTFSKITSQMKETLDKEI